VAQLTSQLQMFWQVLMADSGAGLARTTKPTTRKPDSIHKWFARMLVPSLGRSELRLHPAVSTALLTAYAKYF
jgi:hypothetical protein